MILACLTQLLFEANQVSILPVIKVHPLHYLYHPYLTVRVVKRLQLIEKQQKQQRQEEHDPLTVAINRQQRYLDRWLLRLQRHLDSRRYLWQLPWYVVIGPADSGKTALLREGFSADIIYTPDALRERSSGFISRHISANRR